ncbi:MAG TPA: hypothetical protein PLB34_15340, partial [Rhodoblastus sp.]|nr:hypothetical protein [Rhodoblastus sp.]
MKVIGGNIQTSFERPAPPHATIARTVFLETFDWNLGATIRYGRTLSSSGLKCSQQAGEFV